MNNANNNTMKNSKVNIGTQLYYSDTKDYFGEVIKILKYTCWVKEPNGHIEKRWSLEFANDMLK
tara:strand:+ start:636 stop:827 length:192 start_codon:yes stop_codon:yes gene_type:complete